MEKAERDDQEDHLEERDEDVGGSDHEADNTEDCGHGTLEDWQTEAVKTVPDSVIWSSGTVKIMIRNVSCKIHGESVKIMALGSDKVVSLGVI